MGARATKGTTAASSETAMGEEIEEEAVQLGRPRGRHIKKRALKNKALAVSFNEKDLKDYVSGFHKRKKKRRKEAQKQQGEADRRKRIEQRKKRKFEKELALHGGVPPVTASTPNASDDFQEEEEDDQPIASISGTTTYDNGNMKVTVTTSEISHQQEIPPIDKTLTAAVPQSTGADRKHNVPLSKKKTFKRVGKQKSRPKPQNKRDRKKGKKKNKKTR
ncbi:ribosomal RNA-processing protein 17 [Juglans microcarpa x Juglans regia]|uniref:ribosomal RNA-processing protein 17 n=1 Tax=Juglans microcarpa x Juglans regia TaxID=2249226 RepID=UPI001B7E8749|nr:ribosomal RNA-processing protein 17 [Juglans microcarpa x Juglans regia]